MARTDHGYPLTTPVLKAGSSRFVLTNAGFDTGTRTFTADSDYVLDLTPELETPDTKIRWKEHNNVNRVGRHATMYVSSVTHGEEDVNGIVEITVNYLGLIKPVKRVKEEVSTQTTPFNGTVGVYTGRHAYSTPVVNRVYVSNTWPNVDQAGTSVVPPGWRTSIPLQVIVRGEVVTVPGLHVALWVLRQRDYRKAGDLYEVSDQHVFEPMIQNGG